MTDITKLIEQAAASLSHENPFIAEESFNLYDAMSALDLMEPKMDGCEIDMSYYERKRGVIRGRNNDDIDGSNDQESKETTANAKKDEKEPVVVITIPPRPVPSSTQNASLPWKNESASDDSNSSVRLPLNIRSVRVILVEMLICLESFLAGNSVAESVYTCIYAHESILQDMHRQVQEHGKNDIKNTNRHTELLQKTIYVSTLVLLKLAETIRSLVQRADIYEEEDFTLNAYKFQFGASLGQMAKDPQLVVFQVQEIKSMLMNHRFPAESESNGNQSRKDLDVIVYSMDYMSNLLEACVTLSSLTKDNVVNQAQALRDAILSNAESMKQLMFILDAQSASDDGMYTEQDELVIFSAFDPYINRHLFGNTPVRQVIFSTPLRAVKHLHKIYNELDSGLCTLLLRGSSLARLRRILSNLSSSSKKLNILSRSLIIINLYFDDLLLGQHPLPLIIANDMHQNAVPQTISTTQYGRQFLDRLSKPVYDLLKLYTLNRNRQRHYLDVVMLKDWNKLQEEAATVDICFQREFGFEGNTGSVVYVSNYVLATTIRLMEEHVGLGVELEIFNGHYHLLTAFWYRDFLLSTRLNVVMGMRQQLKARKYMEETIRLEEIAQQQKHAKKTGVGKKKKGKKNIKTISSVAEASINGQDALPTSIEDDEGTIDFLLLTVKRTLCRGIVRFLAALNQAQVLNKPQYKFTSHEICFRKRFETFNQIRQPPLLTHDDFLKGSDFGSVTSTVLISSAADCFTASRTLLEQISNECKKVDALHCSVSKEDVRNLIKVCVGNSLFLMKLSQSIASQDANSLSVSLDFQDSQFCSINL